MELEDIGKLFPLVSSKDSKLVGIYLRWMELTRGAVPKYQAEIRGREDRSRRSSMLKCGIINGSIKI